MVIVARGYLESFDLLEIREYVSNIAKPVKKPGWNHTDVHVTFQNENDYVNVLSALRGDAVINA